MIVRPAMAQVDAIDPVDDWLQANGCAPPLICGLMGHPMFRAAACAAPRAYPKDLVGMNRDDSWAFICRAFANGLPAFENAIMRLASGELAELRIGASEVSHTYNPGNNQRQIIGIAALTKTCDLMTLAHEMGHVLHGHLSQTNAAPIAREFCAFHAETCVLDYAILTRASLTAALMETWEADNWWHLVANRNTLAEAMYVGAGLPDYRWNYPHARLLNCLPQNSAVVHGIFVGQESIVDVLQTVAEDMS